MATIKHLTLASIYYHGNVIDLEIEEYKTLYKVTFYDKRKYFPYLDCIRFIKYKSLTIDSILSQCREYAIRKKYF